MRKDQKRGRAENKRDIEGSEAREEEECGASEGLRGLQSQ